MSKLSPSVRLVAKPPFKNRRNSLAVPTITVTAPVVERQAGDDSEKQTEVNLMTDGIHAKDKTPLLAGPHRVDLPQFRYVPTVFRLG